MTETFFQAPLRLRSPSLAPQFRDRLAAFRASWSSVTGFTSQPEPRSVGRVAQGRQLLAGNLGYAGDLVVCTEATPWALELPSPAFSDALHDFRWIEDFAAVGGAKARTTAQTWLKDWIARYGRGRGPGARPDLAGRRLIRMITHAIFLMNGQTSAENRTFMAAMGRQTRLLARRWPAAGQGLPRFEALVGLVHAATALTGAEAHLDPALAALARECVTEIGTDGGIACRNPQALLEIFVLLGWAQALLAAADRPPEPAIAAAMSRMAIALQTLRHADGTLPRFHGGGRCAGGELDAALSAYSGWTARPKGMAMGFARLSAYPVSVLIDAARPQCGPEAHQAHASMLGLELTCGREPLIVSCGAGASFGAAWRDAGRGAPAHSTLEIEGIEPARFGRAKAADRHPAALLSGPEQVTAEPLKTPTADEICLSHDGYRPATGLTHLRVVSLGIEGQVLAGEDALAAVDDSDRARFDALLARRGGAGLVWRARFHLHPEVTPSLGLGGRGVALTLKSGRVWVFRCDGPAELSLEDSVYLDAQRPRPRATKQIVLSSVLAQHGGAVAWTLAQTE